MRRTRNAVFGAPAGEVKLIGRSEAVKRIHSTIDLVADSPTPVMISGESGTGKEVVSRLIHERSPRSGQPFIAVNCAALPKDIFENELFGHEQGAFTGASGRKEGYLDIGNGGTIFFDELGEMDPAIQAKLLRVLETKSFRRLGGGKEEIKVDVRILAATNKNIQAALAAGELRLDLYYRFSVIEIFLPPLRERKEDIPLLVASFFETFCMTHQKPPMRLSDEALEAVIQYDWPGNVRELRNVIERAVIMSQSRIISSESLPERISRIVPRSNFVSIPLGTPLREIEKIMIQQTLAYVGNNKAKAARVLGLSRKGLHNKLRDYNEPADE